MKKILCVFRRNSKSRKIWRCGKFSKSVYRQILRDVVERLGLKDTVLFDLLLQYIVDTTGRQFSAENVIKFLKSEGKNVSTQTIYVYLDAWCKALMIKKYTRVLD